MSPPLLFVTAAVTLLSHPIGIGAQLPNGACYAEGVACEIQDDNLVGIIGNISSIDGCREVCQDDNTTLCNYITYFGPDGSPFYNDCFVYSTCDTLDPCVDCYTEAAVCTQFCTAPVEGAMGDNIVGVIDDVGDGTICEDSCKMEEACAIFTYHRPNSSLFPSTCFLLTALEEPIIPCDGDTCVTGLPDCLGMPICAYLEDGVIMQQGVKATEGEKNIDLLRLGACPSPVAVAIGGGGEGGDGGGGSGYVSYSSDLPFAAYVKLLAFAGGPAADSFLKDRESDAFIVTGEKGGEGDLEPGSRDGGAGYSGGGGYGNCGDGGNGGSAGSDGEDGIPGADCTAYIGGDGSDLDVSTILLRNFVLSAGEAGVSYGNIGGAGGGVLVNAIGPPRPDDENGQGYGGGGWYYNRDGLPGVVVLDFALEE